MPLSLSTSCRCCVRALATRRALSTSPSTVQIGPESPTYIDVPQPPQQQYIPPRLVKGFLPVPRKIIAPRDDRKVSAEYLDATAPQPNPVKAVNHHGDEATRIAWKERMAASRRKNLREGLQELHAKMRRKTAWADAVSAQIRVEREEARKRPEPEDERLTNPSVMQKVLQLRLKHHDPQQAVRKLRALRASRQKYQNKQALQSQERMQSIHTLYMHAREFITDSTQLEAAIDKEFGTEDNPITFSVSNSRRGVSVWDCGDPYTVKELLDTTTKAGDFSWAPADGTNITQKRVIKIAEEFTGGDM